MFEKFHNTKKKLTSISRKFAGTAYASSKVCFLLKWYECWANDKKLVTKNTQGCKIANRRNAKTCWASWWRRRCCSCCTWPPSSAKCDMRQGAEIWSCEVPNKMRRGATIWRGRGGGNRMLLLLLGETLQYGTIWRDRKTIIRKFVCCCCFFVGGTQTGAF